MNAPRADEIMAAITEPIYERLTRNRDDLAKDLATVVIRFWGLGYEAGLRNGAKTLRDAVLNVRTSKR